MSEHASIAQESTPLDEQRLNGPRAYLAAALIGAAAAVLLCGYECVRSPSNTLFKAAYGANAMP
jgi:hypothetical protein